MEYQESVQELKKKEKSWEYSEKQYLMLSGQSRLRTEFKKKQCLMKSWGKEKMSKERDFHYLRIGEQRWPISSSVLERAI